MRTVGLFAFAVLGLSACSASSGEPVDSGVGPACTNEGALQCLGGTGQVCCRGRLHTFVDGPCGLLHDGGAVDAGADVDASLCSPLQPRCPCDATSDAGAAVCFFDRLLACNAGTWALTDTACPGFCP